MALTASINLNVTVLPDNDIWFANSQSWTNYWKQQLAELTIAPYPNSVYIPVPYNDLLVPCYQNIDSVDYVLVTKAMLDSLKARVNAMEQSYQNLRNELKAIGLLSNAQ